MDRQKGRWMDRQNDRNADGWTNRQIKADGWTDTQKDGQTVKQKSRWTDRQTKADE